MYLISDDMNEFISGLAQISDTDSVRRVAMPCDRDRSFLSGNDFVKLKNNDGNVVVVVVGDVSSSDRCGGQLWQL